MQIQKSDTGKSFDEYRQIIKKLKQKLQIVQKDNVNLQKQYEALKTAQETMPQQLTHPQADTSILVEGNQEIMDKFYNNTKQLGITLEMLFRGTDIEQSGMISIDAFKITLYKMAISLNSQEINKIAQIFDEDCAGIVYKKSYMQTLITYGCNSEPLDIDFWNIGQKTLIDFSKILLEKKIAPEIAWNELDASK